MLVPGNPALDDFLHQITYYATPALRAFLADKLAESTRRLFGSVAAPGLDPAAADVSTLRRTGLIELGSVLDDGQLTEIRDFLAGQPVYNGHVCATATEPPGPLEGFRGRCHYACYAPAAMVAAPHLVELANDPGILRLVEAYLGCPPTLYSVNGWWSFPQPERAFFSQALHRDRDDLRFLTLFVYLTPVTAETGPHRFARFSHDPVQLAGALQYQGLPPAEAQAAIEGLFAGTGYEYSERSEALLAPWIQNWIAPAGSALLADTYALHMGEPPRQGERLMFWARYGLGPNQGSLSSDELGGGIDLTPRIGRDPRARYVNRMLTGDRAILDELTATQAPAT